MTIKLTIKKCRKSLYKIVQEVGADYRYVSPGDRCVSPGDKPEAIGACLNVHEGEASCLIGRMMVDLGVPVSAMRPSASVSSLLDDLADAGLVKIKGGPEGPVGEYLGEVQNVQDDHPPKVPGQPRTMERNPWSEAIRAGDAYLREEGLL